MEIEEHFRLFNPAQPGQKKSRLDHLVEIIAFFEPCVLRAAEELESRSAPYVVAFFQIPRAIYTGQERFVIPAKSDGIKIEFEFTALKLDVDLSGKVTGQLDTGADDFVGNATQVTAYVPLWGKREAYFERYERCFSSYGMQDNVVIHSHESWIDARPFKATDFEHSIVQRIAPELMFSIRRFLKSYSTILKNDYLFDDWLYNYFVMPFPYRITHNRPPTPLHKHFIDRFPSNGRSNVDCNTIRNGIRFTYRKFSRFENQIFALQGLVEAKNYALAVVGGLCLIEWILKINAAPELKGRNLVSLIDHFDERIISEEFREYLHRARGLRNKIVHMGEYTDYQGTSVHEILELDIDRRIERTDATRIIDIAWQLYHASNSGLFKASDM